MASLGLPVPPGFTISTEVCTAYYANGRKLPDDLKPEVEAALRKIGDAVGAVFGGIDNPLLVSVRSGSRASMPGMMDTILNLGLNDATVKGLAQRAGDERFAYDSYRRFIQMYACVVLGVDHGVFEDILDNYKNLNGFAADTELGRRGLAGDHRALQGGRGAREGRALPAGHLRAAVGRDRRRVRLMAEPARRHVPPPARHSGGLGHGRHRPGDGVRQSWASARPPASRSRATPPPACASSTASSWSTPRARTWSRASARRSR